MSYFYSMNFLAHLFLSGSEEGVIVGNFIADHVKGKAIERYNDSIRKGIVFHREIDRYTDSHEVVKRSVCRAKPAFSRYSAVVIDMYYDHFLASSWSEYSDSDLGVFTKSHYRILMKYFLQLPPKTKRILPFMIKDDWLRSYGDLEFLQRAFNGLAFRTKFDSNMQQAVRVLEDNYDSFEEDFKEFFPQLIQFSEARLQQLESI